MNWNLLQHIYNYQLYDHLHRSPEIEQQYEIYRNIHPITKILDIFDNSDIAIRFNKFPYHLENDIHHLIIWIHPTLLSSYSESHILSLLIPHLNNLLHPSDYIIFQNPPYLRSIPLISHFQLFIHTTDNVGHLIGNYCISQLLT